MIIDQYIIALATMSHRKEAESVLEVMGIRPKLNLMLTRDMVSNGKPNPEIYLVVKDSLKIQPQERLVIEDAVNGIKAGLNAGMHVFAVTNDITRASVHNSGLLSNEFIVMTLAGLKRGFISFLNSSPPAYCNTARLTNQTSHTKKACHELVSRQAFLRQHLLENKEKNYI